MEVKVVTYVLPKNGLAYRDRASGTKMEKHQRELLEAGWKQLSSSPGKAKPGLFGPERPAIIVTYQKEP